MCEGREETRRATGEPYEGAVSQTKGRVALSMGEGNFLLVAHEHVQWPAEGLSWTGAPGQHIPRRPFTRLGASTPNLIQSALHLPDSSLHPLCLHRTVSLEFLGSNGISRCPMPMPAAPKPAAATGSKRSLLEAAAGPCHVSERPGSHSRASSASPAPLGRGAAFRLRSERLCRSRESQLSQDPI